MMDLKGVARQIFQEALAEVDMAAALRRRVARVDSVLYIGNRLFDLRIYDRIIAVAFGKAAFSMVEALQGVLFPDVSVTGILVVPSHPARSPTGFRTFVAGHPIPDHQSIASARAILSVLAEVDERTLVFFLISGGGSALVEMPMSDDISVDDLQHLNRLLVTCGAPIQDINIVRKHLSAVKGGQLAVAAGRATKITLAVSDVPAGQESSLASGPTLPDSTTLTDARRVIDDFGLWEKLSAGVIAALRRESLRETPKPGDPVFENAFFEILLSEDDLLRTATAAAEAAGFATVCQPPLDEKPVDQAAVELLELLRTRREQSPDRPVAVIAGGELSSPVTGDGIGGRNSAFVLRCVNDIASESVAVLSAGSDGIDGNSRAAGAVADGATFERARRAGLDPVDCFRRSDAYTFFASLGDAVVTGPTGNNLRDLRVLLALPASSSIA